MISPKQYSISNDNDDDDDNKKATTKHFYWSFMLWLFLLLKAPFGFICATICVSHRTYCICNIRICIRLIQLESLLVFLWVLCLLCCILLCSVFSILYMRFFLWFYSSFSRSLVHSTSRGRISFLFSDLLPFRVCFLRCNRFDIKLLACLQINLQNECASQK